MGLEPHHFRGVRAAIDYAESQLPDGPVKAQEMAWQACMSPFHFERVFQGALGISPGTYVRLRRLSLAASRLLQDPRPASRIAAELGFGSAEAFNRAFHAHFLISPGDFRESGLISSLYLDRTEVPDAIPLAASVPPKTALALLPPRRLIGLLRHGPNEHAANMGLEYELLRRTRDLPNFGTWHFFDRDTPGEPYAMFVGAEVETLSRIPEGLTPLELPARPALLVSYPGQLDSKGESTRRSALLRRLTTTLGNRVDQSAWKQTRCESSPGNSSRRRWTFEIPLRQAADA